MGLVVFGKRETGTHVLGEDLGLVVLDVLDESSVDSLLGGLTLGMDHLLLGTFSKESLGISLDSLVVAGESLVGDLGDINAGNGDLGAGGDSVDLVNALKRHAVHLVRAGDEE